MKNNNSQNKIKLGVEKQLKVKIVSVNIPPQGMDSEVFFMTDTEDNEYVIKYGRSAIGDSFAYKLIENNKIDIPAPKMFGTFLLEGEAVVVLERIKFPLLESVLVDEMHRYIPSMIENLKKIHQIKSDKVGLLAELNSGHSWKEIMLSKFVGANSSLDWKSIAARKGLDEKLVLRSVKNIEKNIEKSEFGDDTFSFLHTDFNQRNLFVDSVSYEIAAIVDWGEAMFGDPIYDFARIRMYIWHFNLGDNVLDDYYKLVSFTPKQKQLEELYWLYRIIEYLAYYSEELNEFNLGRIKMHQDFLRSYKWNN